MTPAITAPGSARIHAHRDELPRVRGVGPVRGRHRARALEAARHERRPHVDGHGDVGGFATGGACAVGDLRHRRRDTAGGAPVEDDPIGDLACEDRGPRPERCDPKFWRVGQRQRRPDRASPRPSRCHPRTPRGARRRWPAVDRARPAPTARTEPEEQPPVRPLPEVGAAAASNAGDRGGDEPGADRHGVVRSRRGRPRCSRSRRTVQERSGGRLLLGLGTGPSEPGALDRLRATVGALREAFAGGTGTVEGSPVRSPLPLPNPPELWIAALGPRATVLAGEIADGVILNWCTPGRVAAAVTQIADGARAAGREPADITVAVYVRAALVPGSLEGARAMAAAYGSYPAYARQFVTMGIDPADPGAVMAGVMLTDRGSATAQLDAYRAAGAHLPVVYPVLPPGEPRPMLRDRRSRRSRRPDRRSWRRPVPALPSRGRHPDHHQARPPRL